MSCNVTRKEVAFVQWARTRTGAATPRDNSPSEKRTSAGEHGSHSTASPFAAQPFFKARVDKAIAMEKAIQTFKGHFIAVLCGTDDSFPLQLWCQILRQAEHQLNMLRKSRINPSISAFEQMYGPHDYDTHPFAILGCAVELHVMPGNRRSWESHTKTGFYIGTS